MSDLLSIILPFTMCLLIGAYSLYIIVASFKYFFNIKNTKELENEINHLKNRLKEASLIIDECSDMHNKILKIEEYLQKKHGLTFDKIEELILQESYKENNVININNFRKFKK